MTFSTNLSFRSHIEMIVNKAYRLIGFIKRTSYDFRKFSSIIHLYRSLVLPVLNHCSVIWPPFTALEIDLLEGVQHRLLRILGFKIRSPMSFLDHDYDPLYQRFKIAKLINLRLYYDQCYKLKILKGFIKDDDIRSRFNLRVLSHNLRDPS